MANFATPTPFLSRACSAGFGLLRMDPSQPRHEQALIAALHAGIKIFDLGSISSPETLGKKVWLERLIRESGKKTEFRFLIRGGIGKSAALPPLLENAPESISWTYFIEGDHGVSYETFRDEMNVVQKLWSIDSVGISSARFTYPKEDPEFLNLEVFLGQISAIEFPLNLYESAAFQLVNQSHGDETVTLLEAAAAYGIETFSRRPFDALTDSQLLRLISYPDHHRLDLDLALQRTLEVALEAEKELYGRELPMWAHRLHSQLQFVNDPEQWKEILRRKIQPDLELIKSANASPAVTRYLECMEAVLLAIQLWCEKRAAERNERIRHRIATSSPELRGASRNLAALALSIYRSMPGLTTVLVGMRSEEYVNSVVKTFHPSQPLLSPEAVQMALDAAHAEIHNE